MCIFSINQSSLLRSLEYLSLSICVAELKYLFSLSTSLSSLRISTKKLFKLQDLIKSITYKNVENV